MNSDLILTATLAVWAAPKGIVPYIRQHFLDTTFRGLYHANAFDVALLIPYFIVLILLAGYGDAPLRPGISLLQAPEKPHDRTRRAVLKICRA